VTVRDSPLWQSRLMGVCLIRVGLIQVGLIQVGTHALVRPA